MDTNKRFCWVARTSNRANQAWRDGSPEIPVLWFSVFAVDTLSAGVNRRVDNITCDLSLACECRNGVATWAKAISHLQLLVDNFLLERGLAWGRWARTCKRSYLVNFADFSLLKFLSCIMGQSLERTGILLLKVAMLLLSLLKLHWEKKFAHSKNFAHLESLFSRVHALNYILFYRFNLHMVCP